MKEMRLPSLLVQGEGPSLGPLLRDKKIITEPHEHANVMLSPCHSNTQMKHVLGDQESF